MQSLRRTRVGSFCISDALTLGELQGLKDEQRLGEALRPVDSVFAGCPALHVHSEHTGLLDNGSFAGIYAYDPERRRYKPVKMFLEKE